MGTRISEYELSKEILGELVDNLDDFIIIQDSSSRYVYLNKSAKSYITQFSNIEDIIGKKPEDILHKTEAETINNQIKTIVKKKSIIDVENWLTYDDKSYCMRELIFPVLVDNDTVKLVGKITRDITLEKQLENSNRQKILDFERIIRNMPFGVLITQNNDIIMLNKEFENITEYSISQLNGMNDFINILSNGDRDYLSNYLFDTGLNNFVFDKEVEIETKLKHRKSIKIRILKIDNDGRNIVMFMITDLEKLKDLEFQVANHETKISEILKEKIRILKELNSKIETRNEYLKDLVDSSNDIIIAFDNSSILRIWNKTIESITNINFFDAYGKNLSKLDFIEPKEKIKDCIITKDCDKKIELIIKLNDDSRRIIECKPSIIMNKYGYFGGLLLVGCDVTEIRRIFSSLVPGHSYMVTPDTKDISKELVRNLLEQGYSLFYVTRGKCNFNNPIELYNVRKFQWKNKPGDTDSLYSLNELIKKLKDHLAHNPKSIIYLERMDYILSFEKFDNIMKSIYTINDEVAHSNSILFVDINPNLLEEHDFEFFNMELLPIPSKSFCECNLLPREMEILRYINEKNKENILISYKDIKKRFSISDQTTSNWLKNLETKNLINIVKRGKRKNLFISQKAKMIVLN